MATAIDDARKIEIMRSYRGAFPNFSIVNPSSIRRQSSIRRRQNERNKTKSTKRAAAAYGWAGRRSSGA